MITINARNPLSKSGRPLTPLPRQKQQKYWSAWLIENAKEEVKNNRYHSTLVRAVAMNKKGELTVADGDMLNELLFGDVDVKISY